MQKSRTLISIILLGGALTANAAEALAEFNNNGDPNSPRNNCYLRCDSKYVIHGPYNNSAYGRCLRLCKKTYTHLQ